MSNGHCSNHISEVGHTSRGVRSPHIRAFSMLIAQVPCVCITSELSNSDWITLLCWSPMNDLVQLVVFEQGWLKACLWSHIVYLGRSFQGSCVVTGMGPEVCITAM